MTIKMNIGEIEDFLEKVFPQIKGQFGIDTLKDDLLEMRLIVSDQHLRPGGTVSGPSIFALADVAAYVATLARIGPEALAVTTNCSIDFMRKPTAGQDLIARARVLKMGRTLSVTDVLIASEGMSEPVARATLTYSLPPKRMETK